MLMLLAPLSAAFLLTMATVNKITPKARNGLMMILSPAKTLNIAICGVAFEDLIDPTCDTERTCELANILKRQNKRDLKTMLSISDKLATSVHAYYDSFEVNPLERKKSEKIPAAFAFDGPAYKALDAKTTEPESLEYLQSNLRIIDPLYGSLRPMDFIQPYRLEMSTKGIIKYLKNKNDHKSLASWWCNSITESISRDLEGRENEKVLINLASDEYSAAVDSQLLPEGTKYVKVVFQQEGRVIAVHAKRARGLMARYIAENKLTELEDVKSFDDDGYSFIQDRSDDNSLVFDRPKSESKPKRKASAVSSTETKKSSNRR
mmetsp:Transcript_23340/g.26587  ORF Transcript_23340/g.26587 Transcript_23340/m.26587 type:complete len:320 (+) Transcript_23340:459-1418(+)